MSPWTYTESDAGWETLYVRCTRLSVGLPQEHMTTCTWLCRDGDTDDTRLPSLRPSALPGAAYLSLRCAPVFACSCVCAEMAKASEHLHRSTSLPAELDRQTEVASRYSERGNLHLLACLRRLGSCVCLCERLCGIRQQSKRGRMGNIHNVSRPPSTCGHQSGSLYFPTHPFIAVGSSIYLLSCLCLSTALCLYF